MTTFQTAGHASGPMPRANLKPQSCLFPEPVRPYAVHKTRPPPSIHQFRLCSFYHQILLVLLQCDSCPPNTQASTAQVKHRTGHIAICHVRKPKTPTRLETAQHEPHPNLSVHVLEASCRCVEPLGLSLDPNCTWRRGIEPSCFADSTKLCAKRKP